MNEIFRFQAISAVFIAIIQLITLILVGRILGAYALGLYAIFQFIFRIGLAVFDPGMGISIIQKHSFSTLLFKKIINRQFQFWLAISIIICCWYYFQSDHSFHLLVVVSLGIILLLILASMSYMNSLMIFQGKQKEIMFAQLISHITEFLVLLTLISFFEPIWAFCGALCFRFLSFYLISLYYIKKSNIPEQHLNASELKDHTQFSQHNILYQLVGAFSGNFDTILMGTMFGLPILGIYNLACEFSYIPFSKINPIFNKAVFPIISNWNKYEIKEDKKLWSPIETYGYFMSGIYLFLFFTVHIILPIIFKNNANELVLFAKLFLVIAFLKGLNNLIFTYILAKGISLKLLKWNVLNLVLNCGLLSLCYFFHWNAETLLILSLLYSFGFLVFSFFRFADQYLFNFYNFRSSIFRWLLYIFCVIVSLSCMTLYIHNQYLLLVFSALVTVMMLLIINKPLFLRILNLQITP